MRKLIGTSSGWIKPKHYGIDIDESGNEYIIIYSFWQKQILRLASTIQKVLWIFGFAIYNPVSGECTPDFNCCANIGRAAWFRFHPKHKITINASL